MLARTISLRGEEEVTVTLEIVIIKTRYFYTWVYYGPKKKAAHCRVTHNFLYKVYFLGL